MDTWANHYITLVIIITIRIPASEKNCYTLKKTVTAEFHEKSLKNKICKKLSWSLPHNWHRFCCHLKVVWRSFGMVICAFLIWVRKISKFQNISQFLWSRHTFSSVNVEINIRKPPIMPNYTQWELKLWLYSVRTAIVNQIDWSQIESNLMKAMKGLDLNPLATKVKQRAMYADCYIKKELIKEFALKSLLPIILKRYFFTPLFTKTTHEII